MRWLEYVIAGVVAALFADFVLDVKWPLWAWFVIGIVTGVIVSAVRDLVR